MSKIKLPTKSPHIDMTPMVDLFTLLLTFFILTTTFRPNEVVALEDTPSSVSEKTQPDANIMTVLVDKDGRVFFNLDNGPDTLCQYRSRVLEEMGRHYEMEFTPQELRKFGKLASFGVPMNSMHELIKAKNPDEAEAISIKGIPYDSTNNELSMWIHYTRKVNPAIQVCIKGDADADYDKVKKVIDILMEKNVYRFNLVTTLDGKVEVKLEN